MPSSFPESLLRTGGRRGKDSARLAGLEDFLGWLRMRRIPTPVPPLGPSTAIGEMLAAVLPCLSLSLPASLSLTHTHLHTGKLPPLSLPPSSRSLSFFPQPSPFSLRLPDEVSALDCWLLAAQFASILFLSLPLTHTHTSTCMPPTTRHMNT